MTGQKNLSQGKPMLEKTDKIVSYVRIGIYAIGLLAVIILGIQKAYCDDGYLAEAIESSEPDTESEEFWPPDMIPHPGCPGDGPKRRNDGDMA